MPVFLNALVLEEESKLKKIMRMHGMKLTHYYLTFILFAFVIYAINNGSLIYVAIKIYRIPILAQNQLGVVVKFFTAWGLS